MTERERESEGEIEEVVGGARVAVGAGGEDALGGHSCDARWRSGHFGEICV